MHCLFEQTADNQTTIPKICCCDVCLNGEQCLLCLVLVIVLVLLSLYVELWASDFECVYLDCVYMYDYGYDCASV